ncbi:hypothetical protein GCM10010276_32480 [Streptomyces longisporus]|uniref:Uncharacterized protein n=1 Tax=Streptomyces longisporus TaxID=1948 RepID=A0ABN3LUR4_STRLO
MGSGPSVVGAYVVAVVPQEHMDWIYGPTALAPDQEPEMYPTIPLEPVEV